MNDSQIDMILIGGSSGSIKPLMQIINSLPDNFSIPVVIVIHRMKNVKSELTAIFSTSLYVCEPEDKEPIRHGHIYIAPQNYHLLIEENRSFSMDYSDPVNYCRPSIDVTFISAAEVYNERVIGILLSGSNHDGAEGINQIISNGGRGIIQHPDSAEYRFMPEAAIKQNIQAEVLDPVDIAKELNYLQQNK